MSLPETIWWCEEDKQVGLDGCKWVHCDRAVALRVAGPDDLLIRRENGNWPQCPTCGGTGQVSKSDCGYDQWNEPCPDCIDGYPKAAVERAAESLFNDGRNPARLKFADAFPALQEKYRHMALVAIRAFHNEGSE